MEIEGTRIAKTSTKNNKAGEIHYHITRCIIELQECVFGAKIE